MPRQRTLKPEYFTDADLCELPVLARLLFAGLWCHADRRGLVEDKPRELKVRILPFDDADVDALLWLLAEAEFITRYEAAGRRGIRIVNFKRHQSPHQNEKDSDLPGFKPGCERMRGGVGVAPERFDASTEALPEGSSAPEQHQSPPVPAPKRSLRSDQDLDQDLDPDLDPPRTGAGASVQRSRPPLVERLDEVHLRVTGRPYDWHQRLEDERAAGRLAEKYGDDEAVRRWEVGLTRGFPTVKTLRALEKFWPECASPEARPASASSRKGAATAADTSWTEPVRTRPDGELDL